MNPTQEKIHKLYIVTNIRIIEPQVKNMYWASWMAIMGMNEALNIQGIGTRNEDIYTDNTN